MGMNDRVKEKESIKYQFHQTNSSTTLTRGQAISQRLREHTFSQQLLHVPFRGAFSLPSPEHPASLLLPGIKLGFDKATDVRLVFAGEVSHSAHRLARAVTDLEIGRHGTVVTSADSLAVEVFRTVGGGTAPFSHDGPLVRLLQASRAVRTDVVDVSTHILCKESVVEDLIVVVVHDYIVVT